MKLLTKHLTRLALLAILAMFPQLASAYDFMVDDLCYNYNDDGTSVTVTYQRTNNYGYSNLNGDLVIPESVTYNGTTYSVTSIGNFAFNYCRSLTSVTIPNSVTSIGDYAFRGCTGLTSVTIPNLVTEIGGYAFYGCTSMTSIDIGNSVTTIGSRAFESCSGLTSVTIPNSVTSIDNAAFRDCSGLDSISLGNSIQSIRNYVFSGCDNLLNVNIVDIANWCQVGLTDDSSSPFINCQHLYINGNPVSDLEIPNTISSIGSRTFYGCKALKSVSIPNTVIDIGYGAFYGCTELTNVVINSDSGGYINGSCFANCTNLRKVIWNVKSCRDFIYNNTYAYNPFKGSSIKLFIIGDEVEYIPNYLCYGLSELSRLYIGKSVNSIGNYAFGNCRDLSHIEVNPENQFYDSRHNCNAIIKSSNNSLIVGCKNSFIDNSITSINELAFYECASMTSVVIPNSIKKIGYRAFYGCNSLVSLTLTGQGAWNSIGGDMPINQLKTVTIGSCITSLGNFGFTPDTVNCYAETPPVCSSGTFSNYDGELHVPVTSIANYFMADYWQNFNNMVNDLTEKVTLDKTSANLVQWETLALTATVVPDECEVLWSSSNPSVAIVDENGIVTATGEGECDIYASLASNPAVYAWCHISSSYPEISLSLSDEAIEINIGEEQTLTCTVTPDNTGLTPTWSSSNENVATVDENGKVTAIAEGECDIIATILDKIAICHVTVTNNVTITLNTDNAIIGASQMLTVYPACTPDVPVELVVTSSDPSVAVARVVNRTNAPAQGLQSFPENGMALNVMEELAALSESKAPALASEKAIMIVGALNGTATITVTTADGMAVPAVLNLRVVDVDGDKVVTASDVTVLYSYLLNGDETYIATSDVNGDGNVTSSDITIIYSLILGN